MLDWPTSSPQTTRIFGWSWADAVAAMATTAVISAPPRAQGQWLRDFAAALATYRKSLKVKADRLTYANLGMMNYYLGRYDDAEAALREAIAMAPEQHLSWSNLGDVLFVAGRQAEAREAYATAKALVEKQLAVNPGDPGMQMDHAWIHAMLGEREEALLEITRALAAAPDDPYASYYEGLVYHRFGETELALAALERAEVLDKIGGIEYLLALAEPVPSAASAISLSGRRGSVGRKKNRSGAGPFNCAW